MTMWDVTAIGEGGLRLSTPPGGLLECAQSLDVAIAGAEANVLASLAALDWHAGWASVLPESALGRRVERELRACGVGTQLIHHVPDGRVGVYFVERGVEPRATKVHFDREDTVFSQVTSSQVQWDLLLDTRILHLTGITAAVSPAACSVVEEAVRRAKAAGVLVSFDVNYRAKMWSVDSARPTLTRLIGAADIVFIRQGDAELLYGTGTADESLEEVCRRTSADYVAVTSGAAGAIGWIDGRRREAPAANVQIIDRLGAGDAFAAGFLHRLLSGKTGDVLNYATFLAALCLSQVGEQVVTTRAELDRAITTPRTGLDR